MMSSFPHLNPPNLPRPQLLQHQGSHRAMLTFALQKAQSAVLLDTSHNVAAGIRDVTGSAANRNAAIQLYSEACSILEEVMSNSKQEADKTRDCQVHTYTDRMRYLTTLHPDIDKELPPAPTADSDEDEDESEFLEEFGSIPISLGSDDQLHWKNLQSKSLPNTRSETIFHKRTISNDNYPIRRENASNNLSSLLVNGPSRDEHRRPDLESNMSWLNTIDESSSGQSSPDGYNDGQLSPKTASVLPLRQVKRASTLDVLESDDGENNAITPRSRLNLRPLSISTSTSSHSTQRPPSSPGAPSPQARTQFPLQPVTNTGLLPRLRPQPSHSSLFLARTRNASVPQDHSVLNAPSLVKSNSAGAERSVRPSLLRIRSASAIRNVTPIPFQTSPYEPYPLHDDVPVHSLVFENQPAEFTARPYWLMRSLHKTLQPAGGYLNYRLFVPRAVWTAKSIKLKAVEEKILGCEALIESLNKIGRVGKDDTEGLLDELKSLEGLMESIQNTLGKKLGAGSVGYTRNGQPARKMSQSAKNWKDKFLAKAGASSSWITDSSPAMAKDLLLGKYDGPNAPYMSVLSRLFEAAQILDQIAFHLETDLLPIKTQIRLDITLHHASEFFGGVVCRFVLADLDLLLDKFVKRGTGFLFD
ncbi:hypothetical protein NEOLI_003787 [Neolecta irregularis DAH-3]|uniref:MIT domain-containing protein n=1 Tax=Neolecta irregularis (strain DAH-3) TaxID=1198029 RepID=A0A1U7LS23_NEOID|nr:hypothetical protein NEOLI_003787 [Neolecta irregularis DAH-3]|eukprot:OLL25444.1 hypothetical protein NEOLI_003787 [Neolecta irregularis DAH-3]